MTQSDLPHTSPETRLKLRVWSGKRKLLAGLPLTDAEAEAMAEVLIPVMVPLQSIINALAATFGELVSVIDWNAIADSLAEEEDWPGELPLRPKTETEGGASC